MSKHQEDIKGWRPIIEDKIYDYFVKGNRSETESFELKKFVDYYEKELKKLFPSNNNISTTVNGRLSDLVNDKQLQRQGHGKYILAADERLYLRVKLGVCEQKLQTIANILNS